MARWLMSFVVAMLAVLASFVMILWMVSPPRASLDKAPVRIGHFVPMAQPSAEPQSRSRLKAPQEPPPAQPPTPPQPAASQPQPVTPALKLDVKLPEIPSNLSVPVELPTLSGLTAATAPAPTAAPAAAAAANPSAAPSAPAAPAPAGNDTEVMPLNEVLPEYPDHARRRGIEGYVKLAFVINAQGRVSNIRIVESSPANVFDRPARRAAARWRFTPRTEQGMAVEREAIKTLEFRLTPKR